MLTAILAFIGTNIDDILVLTVLLSAAAGRDRIRVSVGYMLGVLLITALAALAAGGLRIFSGEWLRLLGIVPVFLGVRAWLCREKDGEAAIRPTLPGAMLITLGNGADNLGVYIPLFARSAFSGIAVSALVFLAMAGLWSLIAARIASLPMLRRGLERRAASLVPIILILLGLYILLL